jgi:DNA-directed RNA polymerase specialized sigma24 family protein
MNKKKVNYINNADFYAEMVKYKEAYKYAEANGLQRPQLSNYIGMCFLLIAKKLTNHPWFIGYSYKDEMEGDAYENCVRYAYNFDTEKYNNPFAYFTQIAWYAFRNRVKKERKQLYIKLKNMEHFYILDGLKEDGVFDGSITNGDIDYEKNTSFIVEFEKSLTEQKEKSKIAAKKKKEKVDDIFEEE